MNDTKLNPVIEPDTAQWPAKFGLITPPPQIFFSGLGTTRGAAGGFAAQYLIDHDLNLALAQSAKAAGVKVYVLISSGGASAQSMFGYPKMKGELEEAVKGLGFEHTVILRPGLIVGQREQSRAAEGIFHWIAGAAGMINATLKDVWAQDSDVIAKAAVSAGLKALEGGEDVPKVWMVGQSDIVRLGRTEWKA